jgi:polyisoprenoid-binding protein YceI
MVSFARRWCLLALIASLFAAMAGAPVLAGPEEGKKPSKKKEEKKKKPSAPKGFKNAPRDESKFVVDDGSDRNEISFKSNIPGHVITGTSKQVTGELEFKPRLMKKIAGRFSVSWSSLDTGNSNRNDHMRSAPWVDANSYPDIVFTVSGVESLKAGNKSGTVLKVKLVGTMAINGAEKEMKIPATLAYIGGKKSKKSAKDEQPEDATEGLGIQARFKIKLADFNIEGRGVGDKVAATQNIKVSLFLKRIVEEQPAEPTPVPKPRTRRQRTDQR